MDTPRIGFYDTAQKRKTAKRREFQAKSDLRQWGEALSVFAHSFGFAAVLASCPLVLFGVSIRTAIGVAWAYAAFSVISFVLDRTKAPDEP